LDTWQEIAEYVYKNRSNNHKANFNLVKRTLDANEDLFLPLAARCPNFRIVLSYILEDRFGFLVEKVNKDSDMKYWGGEDCRRIVCSLSTFIRKRVSSELVCERVSKKKMKKKMDE